MPSHRTGCAGLSHHTSGNARPWQHRPSDHLAGQRSHIYGRILPMQERGLLARIFGRAR